MDTKDPKAGAPRSKINKKGRLIIRNLSFKATEEAVKNWFLRYGEITDVQLLKKQDGTLVGCGFVQYQTVPSAAKAIKECNAKPFLGRPIAIDWAIPKQQYATANNKTENEPAESEEANDQTRKSEDAGGDSDIEGDENDEEESEVEEEEDDEDGEENQDLESDEDNKETDRNKQKAAWEGQSSRKSDVEEGKTVFVRNLDFSTSQDALKNYMEQFGAVQYALLCMDKVMERPRGTGFVKFFDPEAAQKCLEESRNSSLYLDGRTLDAVIAVTRDDLDKQKLEQKKEHKDKRNLYLAREGFIRPGTRAAHGVSASDMAKRQQNEMWKRQMLRNLHMFISRERLCVHNLPPKMTDKQLGKLFKKHSSKTAKIVEARIMRDLKVVGEGNVHPSKGYGFVTFSKHEDALLALRNLNNNPTIFTSEKRPIVEFSVENRAAVKAKLQRAQKSRENVDKGQKKFKGDKPLKSLAADPLANEPVPEFSGAKADPKVKGLPSHSGPKIRHRKRPSAENPDGQGGHPSKKPKISRKMLRNPAHRNKSSMKKKSLKDPVKSAVKKKSQPKKVGSNKATNDSRPNVSSHQQKKKWFDS